MKLVQEKQAYARKSLRNVVDEDQVVRICVDNEFDVERIDKALDKFKTESKYAGLQDFEWNEVQTKEDKREAAKKEHQAEERRRREEERRLKNEEFRKNRNIAEMQKKREAKERMQREKAE